MEKVVSPETVAHLWANQLQSEARTPGNGNLFFDEDKIYSYGRHFVIAKHVTSERGNTGALFSTRTYSVTTSSQQQIVRQAARHLNKIYVPNAGEGKDHNFAAWLRLIKEQAEKLERARKPELYTSQIKALYNQVEIYANFFGYEIPVELKTAGAIANYDNYLDLTTVERAERIKREAAAAEAFKIRVAKERKEFKVKLAKWRKFDNNGFKLYCPDQLDYLRFNTEKNRVETSQKVEIPAAIAKAFYKEVLDTLAAGGCTDCNTRLMDMYSVNEINDKFIRVGCHKIEIKEIKALTKKLGW